MPPEPDYELPDNGAEDDEVVVRRGAKWRQSKAFRLKPGHWDVLEELMDADGVVDEAGDQTIVVMHEKVRQAQARKLAKLGLVYRVEDDGHLPGYAITEEGKAAFLAHCRGQR